MENWLIFYVVLNDISFSLHSCGEEITVCEARKCPNMHRQINDDVGSRSRCLQVDAKVHWKPFHLHRDQHPFESVQSNER